MKHVIVEFKETVNAAPHFPLPRLPLKRPSVTRGWPASELDPRELREAQPVERAIERDNDEVLRRQAEPFLRTPAGHRQLRGQPPPLIRRALGRSEWNSPLLRPTRAGEPWLRSAIVAQRDLEELLTLQQRGIVRLHANTPILSSTWSARGTPGLDSASRFSDVAQLIQELGLAGAARPTHRNVTHVAVLDDGISMSRLRERLDAHGISHPRFAPSLCRLGRYLPAPFEGDELSHGGMCAFAVCIMAGKVTLLDLPINKPQSADQPRILDAVYAVRHLGQCVRSKKIRKLVAQNSWQTLEEFDTDMGISPSSPDHIFNEALAELAGLNVDVVFSTQDHHGDTISGPSGNPHVLCVTAVRRDKSHYANAAVGPGTQGGLKPDVANYTGFHGYERFSGQPDDGTSAATALTSGLVAELRSRGFSGTPSELRSLLRDTAEDLGDPGVDLIYGAGLVRPAAVFDSFIP